MLRQRFGQSIQIAARRAHPGQFLKQGFAFAGRQMRRDERGLTSGPWSEVSSDNARAQFHGADTLAPRPAGRYKFRVTLTGPAADRYVSDEVNVGR